MTYEQIETFLAVITYGNITAAAGNLYVSQSTVSNRIRALEEELGTSLFVRQKGHRAVELTTYGETFVPLASQWASLWQDTARLKEQADFTTLTIASIDSVNNYTLVELFNRHLQDHPEIKLRIHTHHSNEIHQLVQGRAADVGYVFSEIHYPDLQSRPVYRELMYLVCHKDSPYEDNIPCDALDISQEVYLPWGPDYVQWHNRHWNPKDFPLISVNTGSTLQRYLKGKDRWAIAPMSVIQGLSNRELTYHTLKTPPAPRICYEITARNLSPERRATLEVFREELDRYIASDNGICTYESWMSE